MTSCITPAFGSCHCSRARVRRCNYCGAWICRFFFAWHRCSPKEGGA